MIRYGFPLLVVFVAFLLGRNSARAEPEETVIGHLRTNRITLRNDKRAVVISPEGIWLEARDGRASYVEADKFALSRVGSSGRRNLASFIADGEQGAGLVFYGTGTNPRMVVQSGASGSGLIVYGADGKALLGIQGGKSGANIELLGPDGNVLVRLATHGGPGAENEHGMRGSLVLSDSEGKVRAMLPKEKER